MPSHKPPSLRHPALRLLLLLSIAVGSGHCGGDCSGPTLSSNERLIHSSTSFRYVLGVNSETNWMVADGDGDGVTWDQDDSSTQCARSVSACGNSSTSSNQNNILVLNFLPKPDSASGILPVATLRLTGEVVSGCLESCSEVLRYSVLDTDTPNASFFLNNPEPLPFTVDFTSSQMQTLSLQLMSDSMGFQLAIQDQGSCVRLTEITITYFVCPAVELNLVSYAESFSGQTVTGSCIENADPSTATPLTATCPSDAGGMLSSTAACACSTGYQSAPDFMTCSECVANYFFSAGTCTQCPSSSTSSGGLSPSCNCSSSVVTSDGSTSTSGVPCDSCRAGYFRSGGGPCEPCPPLSVRPFGLGEDECFCEEGYVTPSGGNGTSGGACSVCAVNYFSSGSMCTACPAGSVNSDPDADACTCMPGSTTPTGQTTTSSEECVSCLDNMFLLPNGTCQLCPAFSSQGSGDGQRSCVCDEGRVTTAGDNTTTGVDCSECTLDYFPDGVDTCSPCPGGSVRTALGDMVCTCRNSAATADGSTTTTEAPCNSSACAANTFFFNGNCDPCPARSTRDFQEVSTFCSCDAGFTRFGGPNRGCVPIVSFTASEATVMEGGDNGAVVMLRTSAVTPANFDVMINVSTSLPGVNYLPNSLILFPASEQMVPVPLSLMNNSIALEPPFTLTTVRLAENSDDAPYEVDVGGLSVITVTILDDDEVVVGFVPLPSGPAPVVSESNVIDLSVGISTTNIGTPVEVLITSDDQTGRVAPRRTVVFSRGGPTTSSVSILVRDDETAGQGARNVSFTLSVMSPSQGVTVAAAGDGGGSGFVGEAVVIVEDDDIEPSSVFPLGGIIGVAVGGGVLLLILLFLLIVCLCCCRLRVNRRGFYETYEDKSNEPPSMLRYSASLRSISSQTVVPVDGRSAPKENEFYV